MITLACVLVLQIISMPCLKIFFIRGLFWERNSYEINFIKRKFFLSSQLKQSKFSQVCIKSSELGPCLRRYETAHLSANMKSTLDGSFWLLIIISSSLQESVWKPRKKIEKVFETRASSEEKRQSSCLAENKQLQRNPHFYVVFTRTAPLTIPLRYRRIIPSTESRKTQAVKGRHGILPVFASRGWGGGIE